MQITCILTGAFAILANAHWHHPHGSYYQQQKETAPVVGSNLIHNSGSINGSASSLEDTGTGTGIGTGTGAGTGTTGNDPSNPTPASPPQSSGSGTTNPDSTPPSSGKKAGGSTASFTQ